MINTKPRYFKLIIVTGLLNLKQFFNILKLRINKKIIFHLNKDSSSSVYITMLNDLLKDLEYFENYLM